MGEPTVPEEVYREAAHRFIAVEAGLGWLSKDRDRAAVSHAGSLDPRFRAAVESAYRAGWRDARTTRVTYEIVDCTHPDRLDVTRLGDLARHELCGACGTEWTIPRGADG